MPKLKAVTVAEIKAVIEAAENVSADAHELLRRMNSTTDLEGDGFEPIGGASSVLSSSRALSELAAMLLLRAKMEESKRTLEATLRARVAAEGGGRKKT